MSTSFKGLGGGGYLAPPVKKAAAPVYGNSMAGFVGVPKPAAAAPRPVYRAPTAAPTSHYVAPKPPVKPSGKTVGSNKTGTITSVAPPKPVVAKPVVAKPAPLWDATQDTTYQQQEAAAKNAFDDYMAGQTNAQNQYNIEDTRNDSNLADSSKLADQNIGEDFASRGMSQSSMYLKALADSQAQYAKQQSVLDQGALNFGTTAASQLANFRAQQGIDDTKYRNDAINRHSAGLGLI